MDNSKVSFRFRLSLNVVAMAGFFAMMTGCTVEVKQQPAGPSLAELVERYNGELATLDRLERKRKELVTEYEAELKPDTDDAMKLIGDAIKGATNAANTLDPDETLDPNRALDHAVDRAQKTQDAVSKLLQSVGTEAEVDEEEAKRREEIKEKYDRELEALDKEIEAQKIRVERAREARDAAEAELK